MRGVNETWRRRLPLHQRAIRDANDHPTPTPPPDLSFNSLLPFSVFGYTCAGASSFSISLSFPRRTVELRSFPGRKHRRLEGELASWLYFLKRRRSVFLHHLPERLRVRMRKCLFASGKIQIRHSFLDL